ncbi:MAG: nitronate monooxygenase [Thermoleophilaceae bacterium]|nr:nitronate monooxygenase [Thermoleophilaceae bacterium]
MSKRFTDLVGCELPLQLAALGGVGTTELAAAVVGAGGMGLVPSGREPTDGACGINFLMPFGPDPDAVREAAGRFRVVEFYYGDPRADLVRTVHDGGALAGWQVGSAAEAKAAEDAGCDYIAVQGTEGGGHVRGRQPLDEVLPETLAAVRAPVVAAGGVATAERFAGVMATGADAVRVGTRFVPAPESDAHPEYVRRLLEAREGETVLTEWFGENWENAPHRVLASAVEAAEQSGWRLPVPPAANLERDPADMALYAGTGVGHVNEREPAADIVADLVRLL